MPPCQGSKFKSHCSGLKIAINNIFRSKMLLLHLLLVLKSTSEYFLGPAKHWKVRDSGKTEKQLEWGLLGMQDIAATEFTWSPHSEWVNNNQLCFFSSDEDFLSQHFLRQKCSERKSWNWSACVSQLIPLRLKMWRSPNSCWKSVPVEQKVLGSNPRLGDKIFYQWQGW